MADYCDSTRSPCAELIKELGYGFEVDRASNRFFLRMWTKDPEFGYQRWLEIQYCPFCGCRLAILELE